MKFKDEVNQMKRIYEKPVFVADEFQMTTSVAGCGIGNVPNDGVLIQGGLIPTNGNNPDNIYCGQTNCSDHKVHNSKVTVFTTEKCNFVWIPHNGNKSLFDGHGPSDSLIAAINATFFS